MTLVLMFDRTNPDLTLGPEQRTLGAEGQQNWT